MSGSMPLPMVEWVRMLSNIRWKATHSVDFEGKRDWKEPKMSGDIGEIGWYLPDREKSGVIVYHHMELIDWEINPLCTWNFFTRQIDFQGFKT
jgi:hypothetical protein